MMRYLIIFLTAFFLTAASVEDARKANDAYHEGNYAEAIALYKKAIDEDPENARLYFNLGSALAKEGQAEEAIQAFEQFKSMTDDPEQEAMADYNIGNILSNAEEWEEAVDSYKKALRHMAHDEDAKHNYELAKQKKEQQEQQQDQNQQGDDSQDQDQDQNQDQQQDQNDQNEDQQDQNQQQEQDQDQQQNDQQNQQQQPRPQQMDKSEAEKILKALEQKEKDLLKQFKKQQTESSNNTNEKDW